MSHDGNLPRKTLPALFSKAAFAVRAAFAALAVRAELLYGRAETPNPHPAVTESPADMPLVPVATASPAPTVVAAAAGLTLAAVAAFWQVALGWPAAALVLLGLGVASFAVWRLAWGSLSGTRAAGGRGSLLSLAMEANPDGRVIIDRAGRVLYANTSYRQILGLSARAPLKDLLTLLPESGDLGERLRRLHVSAMNGGRSYEELDVTLPEGGSKWLALTARSLTGTPGGPVLWYVEDATARHEIEEAIRAEQGKLVDFIDKAPVGFYSADDMGRFQFANATLAGWLGLSPADLITGTFRLADVIAFSAPELPDGNRTGEREASLIARDGSRRPVRITQSVMRGPAGAEMRTRSVVYDLTQENAWRNALRQAEQHFRDFFDFAPVGIVVLDEGDQVLESNPAFRAMLGTESDGGFGRDFPALVRDEDRAETRERLALGRAGGGGGGAPIEVRLAGASERVAQLYVSRLQPDAQGVCGLLLHLIDTTEQKSLELQFAQSQKMQAVGQLAGGIAHDFNNLLTAMIGFCDLLLLRHQAGDQSFADIMQIKQNANRAANLVRQLLAFSRQQTLRPKVLVVTDVLVELSNLLRRLIGETIELRMTHGRDLGLVKVDQGQFEQVIINLAVNARDAMTEGGSLTIRTANVTAEESTALGHELMPAGEYVLIEAIDTGKGIPKENLGKIFEPFFTTKPVGAGTGLGLSTVYGIVKQTGGFIYPASEPGAGATFRIYLPRFRPSAGVAVEAAEDASRREVHDLTGKGTVLLVEDEDAVRIFAARALRNKGYNVLEANSGDAALAKVNEHQGAIDVLISDVVMPNMDGPTLAKKVRSTWPDMKIIFISGYAEDAFRRNLDRGAEINFLPKPFSLKQLAGKVKEVLGHPEP